MSHITYNESNWLFPNELLVTHDISVDDINYLWNCAFQDDAWAEGVTEQVKAYDRNPGSGRDYLIDEVRIRNAGGTTIHFPFGDRIITFSSKPHFSVDRIKTFHYPFRHFGEKRGINLQKRKNSCVA